MTRHASAIAAAELRAAQSRRDLRHGLHRLRCRLSQPSFLAAVAAAAALFGFSLARRGGKRAAARPLATALIRLGVEYLIARAGPSGRTGSS